MPKALLGDQLPSSSSILSGALGKTVGEHNAAHQQGGQLTMKTTTKIRVHLLSTPDANFGLLPLI